MMKRTILSAVVALVLAGSTGCGALDFVLFGRSHPYSAHYGGPLGYEGDCEQGSCEGNGTAHARCRRGCDHCPLSTLLGYLHPDRLLCGNCGLWGWGCGERYMGDFWDGDRAGCEPCDCHGNWIGPRGGFRSHSAHVVAGPTEAGPTEAHPADTKNDAKTDAKTDDKKPADAKTDSGEPMQKVPVPLKVKPMPKEDEAAAAAPDQSQARFVPRKSKTAKKAAPKYYTRAYQAEEPETAENWQPRGRY